jgi:glucose/mannose-6-phosphate isomerase
VTNVAQGNRLNREGISEVDTHDLLEDVMAIPEHLRDALWKVESANLKPWDSPGGLVVAGMGGSAIGGALARAALGDTASRPILSARTYGVPAWTTPDTTVLCASYSGDTEETLAAYEAAGALGAKRVVVTTGGRLAAQARADDVPVIPVSGGFQPRAAVAYMFVAVMEVAALCGAGPRMKSEIDVAADHLESCVVEWGPDAPSDSLAKSLAMRLHGTIPVIYGAGITEAIAYRWKTQVNENAKLPAFSHELPEMNHNEICGWDGAPDLGKFSAVFLEDADQHPRVARRFELSEELIAGDAHVATRISTVGRGPVERVMSLVLLGDLVSLYLAVLRGVDPTPVEILVRLKDQLAKR